MFWAWLMAMEAVLNGAVIASDWRISGQLSGWVSARGIQETLENSAGVRYIPQVGLKHPISEDTFLDAEMALNGFASLSSRDADEDADLELYRLIFRFAAPRWKASLAFKKSVSDRPISFDPFSGLTAWTPGTPCTSPTVFTVFS